MVGLLLGVLVAASSGFTSDYEVTDFGGAAGFGVGGGASWSGGVLRSDGGAGSLRHSLNLFGKPELFRLKVRGTAGAVVWIGIGSHFQRFNREVGPLTGGDDVFEFPAPPGEGWTHSGAAEKGLAYPLRVSEISVKCGGPWEVSFGELSCVTAVRVEHAVTLLPVFVERGERDGERFFEARCTGWNLLSEAVSGVVRMTVRDWEDDVLADKLRAWTLEPRGKAGEVVFRASIPAGVNFADAEFVFEPGGRAYRARASYTARVAEAGDAGLKPESPWGMGVYLYRYGSSAEGRRRMENAALLAQAAGVKWSREEFSWGRIEPRRGEYDFSYYDVVVDTARRHGISVYGMLAYWTGWTDAYTERGIDDYVTWARAVVRHFKDRVKHWEIYNEPNIFFWNGPKELYPVLMKRAYAAIKEEDPEATVLAISTAGIDKGFIQRCLDAGAPFDVLTVHPYRQWLNEETFMRELAEVSEQVSGRPVWITEMGWSSQVRNVSEREQAELLARCYLASVASGACGNVSWYDFRNDGNNAFYNEENFGVLYADQSPKPAYRALSTVCHGLGSGEPRRVECSAEGVYALEMGGTLAVWTPGASPLREVVVRGRVDGDGLRVVNLMGDAIEAKAGWRGVRLVLRGGSPVFVKGVDVRRVRVRGE